MKRDADLIAILNNAQTDSDFLNWLINDSGEAASSTRVFLDICFKRLPAEKRGTVMKDVRTAEAGTVEDLLYELIAHELAFRLGLSPKFKPRVDRYQTDLSFSVQDHTFLADVFAVGSPQKTIRKMDNGAWESVDTSDPGKSRAHKIAERLREKAGKYGPLVFPFVAFVFLDDQNVGINDVEKALFGMTLREVQLETGFPKKLDLESIRVGGLLLPGDDGRNPYPNLSAVIACDWFDTLNKAARGKRLHCFVIHNWEGARLPVEAFDGFPQITWNETHPGIWYPDLRGGPANTVAKFAEDAKLELKPYGPNDAW